MVICLTVTIIAYTKLLHLIHRHKTKVGVDTRQTTRQQSQETAEMANIAKYKASIRTVMYLVIIMVLFYSPYLVTNIVLVAVESRNDDRFKAAFNITHSILFMNSIVNPAFYCWKIKSIRNAVIEMLPERFQE